MEHFSFTLTKSSSLSTTLPSPQHTHKTIIFYLFRLEFNRLHRKDVAVKVVFWARYSALRNNEIVDKEIKKTLKVRSEPESLMIFCFALFSPRNSWRASAKIIYVAKRQDERKKKNHTSAYCFHLPWTPLRSLHTLVTADAKSRHLVHLQSLQLHHAHCWWAGGFFHEPVKRRGARSWITLGVGRRRSGGETECKKDG